MRTPVQIARDRPAETATPVVFILASLIGSRIGLDDTEIYSLAIVLAFVPAGVTWLVDTVRG